MPQANLQRQHLASAIATPHLSTISTSDCSCVTVIYGQHSSHHWNTQSACASVAFLIFTLAYAHHGSYSEKGNAARKLVAKAQSIEAFFSGLTWQPDSYLIPGSVLRISPQDSSVDTTVASGALGLAQFLSQSATSHRSHGLQTCVLTRNYRLDAANLTIK